MAKVAKYQTVVEEPTFLTTATDLIARISKGDYRLASDLIELGMKERRSGGPRGLLCTPALSRIPDKKLVLDLLKAAKGAPKESRPHLILAFGEFGEDKKDEGNGSSGSVSGVDFLVDQFWEDPNPEVRSALALALGKIGGPNCARHLANLAAASYESEDLRLTALDLIEELAAGGWPDVTSRQAPDADPGTIVGELKEILNGIVMDRGNSEFLRMRAVATSEILVTKESDTPCHS